MAAVIAKLTLFCLSICPGKFHGNEGKRDEDKS